jgi:sec-independent protein translocase protein TatB
MSGVGFWELILLFLIGLIVLGPERLPRVANQLGKWLGQARRMTRVMKRQLEDELNLEKEFNIRPQPASQALPHKPVQPANEVDDTYSPAHEAHSPGSGVGKSKATAKVDQTSDADVTGNIPVDDNGSHDDDEQATSGNNGKT